MSFAVVMVTATGILGTLLLETHAHDMRDINDTVKSLRTRMVIEGQWELLVWQDPLPTTPTNNRTRKSGNDLVELYDIEADPEEQNNVASAQPEVVQRLTAALDAWYP